MNTAIAEINGKSLFPYSLSGKEHQNNWKRLNSGPNLIERLATLPQTLLAGNKREIGFKVAAAFVAVGLITAVCAPVTPSVVTSLSVDSMISGFCSPDEVIPVLDSDRTITRGEYIIITEQLLRGSDPFVGGKSFADIMQTRGYQIGRLEQNCPGLTFEANEIGSLRRLRSVPDTDANFNVRLRDLEVYQGEWYKSYGRIPVKDKSTGEVTYFSWSEPWEPTLGREWPTFVKEGDEQPHVRAYKPLVTPVLEYSTVPANQFPPNRTRVSNHRLVAQGK